jgi:hypothetical protein
MMHRILSVGVAGCMLLGAAAQAQIEMDDMPEHATPKAEKKAKKNKPAVELKELVLRGTVAKQEKERKGKMRVTYQLREQSGLKIRLPKAKGIDLDRFIGKEVTVTGKGTETERKGKKVVTLKKITEVRPVAGIEEAPMGDDEGAPDENPFDDAG